MSTRHSYEGRLEVQTDGVSGSAGYNPLDLIGSARLNAQRTATNVPRRGIGHKSYKTGLIDVEISFAMTWDDSDTVVAAIEAASWNNSHLGVKFLDSASGTGYTADMLVSGFEFSQDEDGIQIVNITMKPTHIDTAPTWS